MRTREMKKKVMESNTGKWFCEDGKEMKNDN